MLSRSFTPFRQAETFSWLFGRVWSSQLCKNFGDIHCLERYAIKTFQKGKRSLLPLSCSINTSSCYLKESRASTRKPEDAVKDESTNTCHFDSAISDEEDAEISNPRPRSKLPSALADYTLDENGFMNIQDLVDFLKKENAMDICVIKTGGIRQNYVDYFVVVSGVSTRHIRAMAKNLEQLFRGRVLRGIGKDGHVIAEGLESDHWVALDIGNIVVHFFLPEVREVYELEKLWTLGPKYDDQTKAMLEEDKLRQAAELGIKLDKPVSELDENLDDLDIDPLGLDDPRRY